MRLLPWAEFAKCEPGTVFQVLTHGSGLGELQILGGISVIDGEPRDFVAASLLPDIIDRPSFGETSQEALAAHPDAYAFVVVPNWHGRDGLFEYDNRSWLVWDDDDRKRLAGWLLDPEAGAAAQNDDPAVLLPMTVDQTYLP